MSNEIDIEQHLKSFTHAFILDTQKERWLNLLCKRTDDLWKYSPKFFNHLNHRYIEQNDSLKDVALLDTSGVYYDFHNEPECMSFADAINKGTGRDALFSIIPGKLAVYFYHENWNFVCTR